MRNKILIVGASSDIAKPLIEHLLNYDDMHIGLHYSSNYNSIANYEENDKCSIFQKTLNTEKSCQQLVDEFVNAAGGIDCMIQLCGNVTNPVHWESLTEEDVFQDLQINLVVPFFLAKRSIQYMKLNGGSIVLMSNAGAKFGGGSNSLFYGISKAGIDRLTKGLAKDCAKYNILVNAVAPGFIDTKFHRDVLNRNDEELKKRIDMIPLKRAGKSSEVASTIIFLLSDGARFITGEVITISGGDWL
ncbi:hypothetical protein BHU72_05290 [Desulfuribacillus stibiiarsenatis]|uniref:Short-chain dehydrogenase n=1 Tax=Desulfuribacillus stibiiarsenatis TaxID=1390249 RepID=A0A1E5L5V3_9FIRM|nr:SDR family oxidoreductase [Desulfuribacillus stibiiarsenatis]OEH85501.1 hypothetical protein BHU72_05290 [Desulfuribacillus stibiiarsenatis]